MWILSAAASRGRGQTKWVVLPHVVQLFKQHTSYSEAAIRQKLSDRTTQSQYRKATPGELSYLKDEGVVGKGTTMLSLVSLKKCLEAGRQLGVPDSILTLLSQQPMAVPLAAGVPTPQAAPAPPQPASLGQGAPTLEQLQYNTTAAAIQPVCPDRLPTWQGEVPKGQYGLTTQDSAKGGVLTTAMGWVKQLHEWSTEPVRLSRPQGTQKLAASSWDGIQGEVLRFLGFAHQFRGVQQPTLHHYLNGFLLVDFISLLQARGVQPQQQADAVHQAERAVTFLARTNRLSVADMQLLPAYKAWLANLAHQLSCNLVPPPKPSLAEQLQQGTSMQAKQLLLCLHKLRVDATEGGHLVGTDQAAATLNMQAALCCSMFGWLPPIRPSVLISLLHPAYKGPCPHPDCQQPTKCKGNRVIVLEPEYPDSSDSDSCSSMSSSSTFHSACSTSTEVRLFAPHHKISKWWGTGPIDCELPYELADLYLAHHHEGREVIQAHPRGVKGDCKYFFLQSQKGQQLSPQQVSQIFSKVVLPATHSFGPQKARSIFVTAARDKQLGQLDEGAAAGVMGNSLTVWEGVYDQRKVARGTAKNVAALAKWRAGVLAEAAAQGSVAAAMTAWAAAGRGGVAAGAAATGAAAGAAADMGGVAADAAATGVAAGAAAGMGGAAAAGGSLGFCQTLNPNGATMALPDAEPMFAAEAAAAVIGVEQDFIDLTMDLD